MESRWNKPEMINPGTHAGATDAQVNKAFQTPHALAERLLIR